MGRKKLDNDSFDKIPPQNIEAEQAILGAMLINEKVIPEVTDILESSHLYKDAHKDIFEVILDLFNQRKTVDILTVQDQLKKSGKLTKVGGLVYLTHLLDNVPSVVNAPSYAEIVKEKAILRFLINSSLDILSMCYKEEESISSLLDKSERLIFDISNKRGEEGYVHIKSIIHNSIELIDNLYQNKSNITGVPTGFKDFDIKTSGLHPGELIVIAGRPSMGKSAFAGCIAENVAVDNKIPVGFFSIEMSKDQITQRFLCSRAKVDAHKVRTGFLSTKDWPFLTSAAGELSESPLYIDDSTPTIFDLRAKARRLRSHHNIQLIIVDYLQLIRGGSNRVESRQVEISGISQALKSLAKELEIPIIAISQLSRETDRRENHTPRLSDLRESGAIEQDADLVVLLYREDYYNSETSKKGITEVIIAKQRNGPTGVVELGFIKEYLKFVDLDFSHKQDE